MPIPLSKPYFIDSSRKNILSGIDEVFKSGQLMMGKWTSKFESSFKIYANTDHAKNSWYELFYYWGHGMEHYAPYFLR